MTDFIRKSTVDEIRKRFDRDVERFTNEVSGQTATVDAALVLDLIADSVKEIQGNAASILDIGCGGGNFTIRILRKIPGLHCTLLDLSRRMIDRAAERVHSAGGIVDRIIQEDVRTADMGSGQFDIVVSGAVLHHLRNRTEWIDVFRKIHRAMKPGGTYWFWDLVRHENGEIEKVQRARYEEFLRGVGGKEYQDEVFAYIEREDTPESATFIIQSLAEAGFVKIDILHKNVCYAAVMAVKPPDFR